MELLPGSYIWKLTMGALASLATVLGATVVDFTQRVSIEARAVVDSNFRGPFDLLVLDSSTDTSGLDPLGERIFRSNYLSSVTGQIPWSALTKIDSVSGVEAAAPLSVLGTTLFEIVADIDIGDVIRSDESGLYLLETSWISDGGLSRYENLPILVYHDQSWSPAEGCSSDGRSIAERGFAVSCVGPEQVEFVDGGYPSTSGRRATYGLYLYMPLVVAVIDPVAEQALTGESMAGLARSMAREEQLDGVPQPRLVVPGSFAARPDIDTYPETIVHSLPFAGSLDDAVGLSIDELRRRADTEVFTQELRAAELYSATLDSGVLPRGILLVAADAVRFSTDSGRLAPESVSASQSAWADLPPSFAEVRPPGNEDTQFRATQVLLQRDFRLAVSDTFDVSEASDLGLGLGVYDSPTVLASSGAEMGPTMNLGAYLQQPPTVLITRESAQLLGDGGAVGGQAADIDLQPTSVRVRVSEAYATPEGVAAVAERIRRAVPEVKVVSVSGTGGVGREILLAGNSYGRPSMMVEETWIEGGRALTASRGIATREALSYLLLTLTGSLGFYLVGFLLVRSQREERAALRSAGCPWSTTVRVLAAGTVLPVGAGVILSIACLETVGYDYNAIGLGVALGIGAVTAGAGVIAGARPHEDRNRFRASAQSVAGLVAAELLNRPVPWMLAMALLGASAGLGGLLLNVHFDLVDLQVGNGVQVLTADSRHRQLWLVSAGIALAVSVTSLAGASVRLSEPQVHPGVLVGWDRRLHRRVLLLRQGLVAATTASIATAILFLAASPLKTNATAGGVALAAIVAIVGTGMAER